MNCPGGCIAGGGQPRTAVPPSDAVREQRDCCHLPGRRCCGQAQSHQNEEVAALTVNSLEHPMSELAEELLHTDYQSRADKLNRLLSRVG